MYPDEIFTQRDLENLPGLSYDPDNKKTLFAEDLILHGDNITAIETTLGLNPEGEYTSVAERLDNTGGGGGAWELLFDVVNEGTSDNILCDTLDLQTDKIYEVYFGVNSEYETTNFIFSGSSEISVVWSGFYISSGSLSTYTGPPYISHPSIGPGAGKMTLTTTPNGTLNAILECNIANQRYFSFRGADANWYSGGLNLTSLKLETSGGAGLLAGSYMSIFRKVAT